VVEVDEDLKEVKSKSVNKTRMAKDKVLVVVEAEEVGQASQELSALDVESIAIMQRSANQCYSCGKVRHFAKDYRSQNEREETINLVEEVEDEVVLLMMGCSLGVEHKQVENLCKVQKYI